MNEDAAQVARLKDEYERGRADGREEVCRDLVAEVERLRGVDRGSPQHLAVADRLEAIAVGREVTV